MIQLNSVKYELITGSKIACFNYVYGKVGGWSLPEEGLAEGAVRLVGGVEPLADAAHVELVQAVLAGQSR